MHDSRISELSAQTWNIELTEPFGIAGGSQLVASNVLVEVRLADGTRGLGEAAPFPAVSGETQAQAMAAIHQVRDAVLGQDASRFRRLALQLAELIPALPSARAGIEAALLDALCRRAGISLQRWFGGCEDRLETDITIVTGTEERARLAATRAANNGFNTLKLKVGGGTLDQDLARLRAVRDAAPGARVIVDANASFSAEQALELIAGIGHEAIALFEQPVAAADLDGMRRVRESGGVLVAADEGARSAADVAVHARHQAADVINIKITKSGIAEACDMIATARALGLRLMIGGMVETPLAMVVSACLAAGQGGFEFVDLDTPLFMLNPPVRGWMQHGPIIELGQIEAGHGLHAFAPRP